MKTLLMILLTTVSMYAQKDTIYLTWRGDKFYEVAETIGEDGRRTINETPIGDTLKTVEHYVKNADEVFNKLSEAAGLLIQKNAIINGVNAVNKMLMDNFNTDLVMISKEVVSLAGNYKLKMPDTEVTDASIDQSLILKYDDSSIQVIPVGYNYIQLLHNDTVYELYRVGEGQYASLDVQTVLIKNETK